MTATLTRELERLTHSGVQLADPATDVRDRNVYDRDGLAVGAVSDVLVDPENGEVRLVEVTSSGGVFGFGRKSWLVPVEALTSGDPRTVYVERTREEILAAEPYQAAEGDEEEAQYAAAYAAYGVTPYWSRT